MSKIATYKIILLGDGAVGKTTIRHQYMGKGFESSYLMTMGADFSIKRMGRKILQIWDLAGQDVFSTLRKEYYFGASGALLVFDLSRPRSFNNLHRWITEIEMNTGNLIPIVLLANKLDLIDGENPLVTDEMIDSLREEWIENYGYNFPILKTSAKTGFNIDKSFIELISEIDKIVDSSVN